MVGTDLKLKQQWAPSPGQGKVAPALDINRGGGVGRGCMLVNPNQPAPSHGFTLIHPSLTRVGSLYLFFTLVYTISSTPTAQDLAFP
ncbi:hypothetical protein D3A96_10755 [Robertkochia marina]|nr:hypothetical protein D3A96_10755 [Robertkochia marina]